MSDEAKVAEPAAAEDQGAKVIIVTEAGGHDRRYRADGWDSDGEHRLTVGRKTARSELGTVPGRNVAEYNPAAWLSVREDGAEVPDYAAQALTRARRALRDVLCLDREDGASLTSARDMARDAIADLFDLGFE